MGQLIRDEHTTFCLDNGVGASLQDINNVQGCFTLEESFFIRDISAFSIDRFVGYHLRLTEGI